MSHAVSHPLCPQAGQPRCVERLSISPKVTAVMEVKSECLTDVTVACFADAFSNWLVLTHSGLSKIPGSMCHRAVTAKSPKGSESVPAALWEPCAQTQPCRSWRDPRAASVLREGSVRENKHAGAPVCSQR